MPAEGQFEVDNTARSSVGSVRNVAAGGSKPKTFVILICAGVVTLFLLIGLVFSSEGGGAAGGNFLRCAANQTAVMCTKCDTPQRCLECAAGYQTIFLVAGDNTSVTCEVMCTDAQKLMSCTTCTDNRTCTECSEGWRAVNGSCLWACDEFQIEAGCTTCSSAATCSQCVKEKQLVDGVCVSDCTAEQVTAGCNECDNGLTVKKCTACEPGSGFVVHEGRCVNECVANGENDVGPNDLGPPKFNNGMAFQRMCVDEEVAHFFAIGDWGGFELGYNGMMGYTRPDGSTFNEGSLESPNKDPKWGAAGDLTKYKSYDYDLEGIDGKAQKLVADQMNDLAKIKKPRFVINVGDSFYWGGLQDIGCGGDHNRPEANEKENSERGWYNWRWETAWKKLYDFPNPDHPDKQIPWLSVLGNHDYGGFSMDSGFDHQVYYTYKPGTNWRLPGLWWSQEVIFKRFSMELFFLDGNSFDAFPTQQDPTHNICHLKDPNTANGKCKLIGHPDLEHGPKCYLWFQKNWADGKEWLEKRLKKSQAHWTAVVAHYPGNCGDLEVMAMMKRYGVDMCVVGHTHWQEITQVGCSAEKPCTDRPIQIITGGGGGISAEAKATEINNMYGFIDFKLTKDRMEAVVINQDGFKPHFMWNMTRRPKETRGEGPVVV